MTGAPVVRGKVVIPPPPTIMVRDIQPLGGDLFAVYLRMPSGGLVRLVVSRRLATLQTVAISAHAVARFVELGLIHLDTREG